jgi:hypothetical protein
MARRTTKDPRKIIEVLLAAHNNTHASNDSDNESDIDDMPDDASDNTSAPKPTTKPSTKATTNPNTTTPHSMGTSPSDSPALAHLHFINARTHLLSRLYAKITFFRTSLSALVLYLQTTLTTALNTIDNAAGHPAAKAALKVKSGGRIMLIKELLVECAKYEMGLDGLEGEVRGWENEEQGMDEWGPMDVAEYLLGKVDELRELDWEFGERKRELEGRIEGVEDRE